jgi:hypothetical protein
MPKIEIQYGKCPICSRMGIAYSTLHIDFETKTVIKAEAIDPVSACQYCGAKQIDGVWKKICIKCGEEVDELYGLFVPHLCIHCYSGEVSADISAGRICTLCGKPRCQCCC